MDTDRQEVSFDEGYQNLLLLGGEQAVTVLFNAQLQVALDRVQEDLEFAFSAEEVEVVRLRTIELRKLLENQERFLLDLREKALAECWPDVALPEQAPLN